jgi:hypothetical protein
MRQNKPDMIKKNYTTIRRTAGKIPAGNGVDTAAVVLIGSATCGIAAGALDT